MKGYFSGCSTQSRPIQLCRLGRGFTLIEVLMAMVVLALGCMVTLGVISSSIRGNDIANAQTMSTFLAESQIEWLRSLEFNEVPFVDGKVENLSFQGENCEPDCIHDSPPCQSPVCYYKRTTFVTEGYPTSRSQEITVKLEWTSDRDREFIYKTVISTYSF